MIQVIVCIDTTYAKVAAGVAELAKKLHVTIVALVAGVKVDGRWSHREKMKEIVYWPRRSCWLMEDRQ